MDYTGGEEKRFNSPERPVFGSEIFSAQPEKTSENRPEKEILSENPEEQSNDNTVEMAMPPGMDTVIAEEQMAAEIEETEKREHKNTKAWVEEIKENIEKDGDDPRKLQEDWVKNANRFLSESYSRRWGDRN